MIGRLICSGTLFRLVLLVLFAARSSFAVELDYGGANGEPATAVVCADANKAIREYTALIQQTWEQEPKLVEALRQFPKGADIHNHLSGAVMPEDYTAMGAAEGNCYGPDRAVPGMYTITAADPSGFCTGALKPIAAASETERLRILQSLSMFQYTYPDIQHGHDQFFATSAGSA